MNYISQNNGKKEYIPPNDPKLASYMAWMNPFQIKVGGKTYQSLGCGTSMPLVRMPKKQTEFEPVFQRICELGEDFGGKDNYRFLIGELTDNMYQHAEFEQASVMAQRYKRLEFLDTCFIDDGITIGGSLKKAGMDFQDDAEVYSSRCARHIIQTRDAERLWTGRLHR